MTTLGFQHSQILDETFLHQFLEVALPWKYLGEEVVQASVEAEAESFQVHKKVLLEKGVEGAVVSLELDVVQAVEEVQELVMVMELRLLLLTKSPQKAVEEAVEGEEGVGQSPRPCPFHRLDQQYLTREFEALKRQQIYLTVRKVKTPRYKLRKSDLRCKVSKAE